MGARVGHVSNFAHLEKLDEQLVRLGMLAERYFADDPNTSLLKVRQVGELLAQMVAAHAGLFASSEEPQYDLLHRLQDRGVLPREVAQLFGEVRRAGNAASHAIAGDHRSALSALKFAWQIGVWFHRTFKNPKFSAGPFIPPRAPHNESEALKTELAGLQKELDQHRAAHQQSSQRLSAAESELVAAKDDREFWEQMARESDAAKSDLEKHLAHIQKHATTKAGQALSKAVKSANAAAVLVELSEADTRALIDDQLRTAGWEANTEELTYSAGARPQKGRNMAIAEWPTATGPADYVLFVGLTPVATVEAKRKNVDVSGSLQQAKRYSRGFNMSSDMSSPGGPWDKFNVPLAFSTNGRPFLRQIETKSGIWSCDLRRPSNIGRPLDGWYTPERVTTLLKRDVEAAHKKLRTEPFAYGFTVRPYQQLAIQAVEDAIRDGQREMLLAMATGTGKTKTCIALIYRLLKTQRFSRVLFLVDRSALGEQAANAFKETRMEGLRAFADVFGIKELDEKVPDSDTAVHIATIQGMAARVLSPGEEAKKPPVDQYDCIIVDECHRGYLLDRELSDTELGFRSYEEYISQYRRVLDYFDAVKVGLTATPALHTTKIFGMPVYTYDYRQAVIDGWLVDHEPPIQIQTKLSKAGIKWKRGEKVPTYNPRRNQVSLITAPDEINLEIDDFNKKVITKPFNRIVCKELAKELDPNSRQKTLIFCANDAHCDLVVDLLKKAFIDQYGSIDDDAVLKITGAADKPLQLIRRYKNERAPNVAVTVDLLTTGVDVPEICNLVFLRRVNSRILFDQMLGRATRLCPEIGKEAFRVFDAVRIYEALQNMTAMQPVVVDPTITFTQLAQELAHVRKDEERQLALDQFLAKLQRKKHSMTSSALRDFETTAGMPPATFIERLERLPLAHVAKWFTENPDLGEILDRKGESNLLSIYISEHPDELHSKQRGYGRAVRPADYLKEFSEYLKTHRNEIPALLTVLTRPRELTRKQLRELALALDTAGFAEANLKVAWREMTNQEIAAGIVGFIRQAALGDTLLPYVQRVENALQSVLKSRNWSTPQRQWLQKIAAQTKANVVVDREALDDPDLLFQREGGGFVRLNKLFDGELQKVLDNFNEALWKPAA